METKRFFSFLKRWKRLDSSWSMELASLDVHFRGSGKAKLLEEAMGKESEAEKDWKAMRQKDGTIPLAWKVYRDRTVQFKARQIYATGLTFVRESHSAWISQKSPQSAMEYAAERAEPNGTHRLSELAALLSDVKRLPDLGFPDLAGLQDMPEELFSEASMLAADFVDLVVQSMVQLAWDTSWWSQVKNALDEFRSTWASVFALEKVLLPQVPEAVRRAEDVELRLTLSGSEMPELSQLYWLLEGVAWQYVREVVGLLEHGKWHPDQVLQDPRQRAALNSLLARDKDKIMPVGPPPSDASISAYNRFRKKKLITQAVFSPQTNAMKAKRSMEQGRPFDVGYPTPDVDPLIDLNELHGPSQKKRKRRKTPGSVQQEGGTAVATNQNDDGEVADPTEGGARLENDDGEVADPTEGGARLDTKSLLLLPASKLSSYIAASAWASLTFFEQAMSKGQWEALETQLGRRWLGGLLHEGQVYRLMDHAGGEKRDAVCLGFYGYAAMFWEVKAVEVTARGFKVFSMKDTRDWETKNKL
ncbi:unnamed protein product [Durusdinium trenchii]|uniref:Uncharacterized protein n=1 Tax=Durusdinium trenchii TaxID=1381693 RepID=A0ABP0IE63_9DINO